MVEAGGIEPPSETASCRCLRACPIIESRVQDAGRQARPCASGWLYKLGRPVIRLPAGPASQRIPAQQISAVQRRGLTRPRERNHRSRLVFAYGINEDHRHPRRATGPRHAPSKPVAPSKKEFHYALFGVG